MLESLSMDVLVPSKRAAGIAANFWLVFVWYSGIKSC